MCYELIAATFGKYSPGLSRPKRAAPRSLSMPPHSVANLRHVRVPKAAAQSACLAQAKAAAAAAVSISN